MRAGGLGTEASLRRLRARDAIMSREVTEEPPKRAERVRAIRPAEPCYSGKTRVAAFAQSAYSPAPARRFRAHALGWTPP